MVYSYLCPLLSSPILTHQSVPISPKPEIVDITIRAVQTQDLHDLAEILSNSFHSCQGWRAWTYPLFKLGIYEDLRTRFSKPNHPYHLCLVALAKVSNFPSPDLIIGTAEIAVRSLFSWSSSEPESPYISNLAVSPIYRRRGVARKLLLRCEQTAQEWGFPKISLHVLENNIQARRLYASNGYLLQRTESTISSWLFQRPRRLLLEKQMSAPSTSDSSV